jgi:hypothetical protein
MEFEKHLFISYAHVDNRPLSPEQLGWVTRFHNTLDVMLTQRLPHQKAVIWRDQKLAGNDVFGAEIISQFPKTALLISVLSTPYIDSEWCPKEVDEFCKAASQTCGILIGNKCRVFKVIKSPVDRNVFPDVMKSSLGYQFYELDEDDAPLELDPTFGEQKAQKFYVKVNKLAWEIKETLKALADAAPAQPAAVKGADYALAAASVPVPAGETLAVYLAECSYDKLDTRDALDAELKLHGYRVLPEHELPRGEADYRAQVAELLNQCRLSIHLVGSTYGGVPVGPSEKSVVVIQNELATKCSRDHGLRRIIWLPDGLTPKKDEQTAFIAELQTSRDAQFGADLITSIEPETIKTAMHAALARIKAKQAQPPVQAGTPDQKLVYLICDLRDRSNTIPLRRFLKNRKIEVRIPIFEGDAATMRQANDALLKQSSGVVIFYGEGGEAWKRAIESDAKKIRGGAEQIPVWTYLAGPATDAKTDLIELEEPQIVNCLAGFSEAAMTPLVEAFEKVIT